MGFFRQEYWSRVPFTPPGDLLDPGIEPLSLMSPALAGIFFTTSSTWEGLSLEFTIIIKCPCISESSPCLEYAGSSLLHRLLRNCGKWGLLFIVVHGLLTVVVSLVVGHRL